MRNRQNRGSMFIGSPESIYVYSCCSVADPVSVVSVSDCSFILSFILPGERWGAGDSGNSRTPGTPGTPGTPETPDGLDLYDLFVYAFTLLNQRD